MKTWKHKPGPKGPRHPESRLEGLPLEVIIDLTEPLEFEHLGERRTVGRRMAQALAVTLVTGGFRFDSLNRTTAAKYRAIVRAIPEDQIPTPIGKQRRGRKLTSLAVGLVSVLHPVAQVDQIPVRTEARCEASAQVDITRSRRGRRGRRSVGEIFEDLRRAA